eukprot:3744567-Amphidinium_carterae.1
MLQRFRDIAPVNPAHPHRARSGMINTDEARQGVNDTWSLNFCSADSLRIITLCKADQTQTRQVAW